MATLVEVTREGNIESFHAGEVVVADAAGRIIASTGAPETFAFFRSSAKPFQSIPLVESGAADAFGFGDEQLAMACASHNATPRHQELVAGMLSTIGLSESALQCGFSPPADEVEAAKISLGLKQPDQVKCECSGEHAGMLAVCVHQRYPIDSYLAPEHPLQQRILRIISTALRLPISDIVVATDGCSLPTFGAPISAFAAAYATIAALDHAERASSPEAALLTEPLSRLRHAILSHPALISDNGVLDTDLMRLTNGRIVAKLGAEGLLCLAVPERGLGIAVKSIDGMPRSLGAIAFGTLEQLDLLDAATFARLHEQHLKPIETFRGKPVGELRPVVNLSFAS